MDVQEKVNLGILRELRRRGIAFARPTRVVHLADQARSAGDGGADTRQAHAGMTAPLPGLLRQERRR
jgi:hypothetical protein